MDLADAMNVAVVGLRTFSCSAPLSESTDGRSARGYPMG